MHVWEMCGSRRFFTYYCLDEVRFYLQPKGKCYKLKQDMKSSEILAGGYYVRY